MKITIQKSIPMPAKTRGRGAVSKYPFAQMEVGDSFAVPLSGTKHKIASKQDGLDITTQRIAGAAFTFGRRHGMKFSVRELKGEGVARCWRVK